MSCTLLQMASGLNDVKSTFLGQTLRLEATRLMIERSRHLIQIVAKETGFVDPRRMREALRMFGRSPQVFRRNARENRERLAGNTAVVYWRLRSESNRRTRLCRPLHDHSAT